MNLEQEKPLKTKVFQQWLLKVFKMFKVIYYLEYRLNKKKVRYKKKYFFSKIYKYIENTLNTLNIEQKKR